MRTSGEYESYGTAPRRCQSLRLVKTAGAHCTLRASGVVEQGTWTSAANWKIMEAVCEDSISIGSPKRSFAT